MFENRGDCARRKYPWGATPACALVRNDIVLFGHFAILRQPWTASPQGIAALAAQGGVATLTEGRDETFPVGQFSSADRE